MTSSADAAIDPMLVFDRRLVGRHRRRAAGSLAVHAYLFDTMADAVVERLADIARRFPCSLDLGAHHGGLGRRLLASGTVDTLVSCDLAPAQVASAPGLRLAADEEILPFRDGAFDLIASAGSLHWVNDLPGTLIQIRDTLAPDGLFVGAVLGGATLSELRQSFLEAEARLEGRAGLHISPFLDLRDAAALLQRAGFAMPVADIETVTVTYPDALALMRDLRAMGESNALQARRRVPMARATLAAVAADYATRCPAPGGRVYARFDVVTLTGWAPGPGQPVPKRPGSAQARLADALGTVERPLR